MDFGFLMTAMITPFDGEGQIDAEAIHNMVEHLVASRTDTIVTAGTTGESPTLSPDERIFLLQTVKKAARGRVKVLMGTGTNDTRESIENSRLAVLYGADGIMLVTPYYNKPPQDSLYQHFMAVARSVDVPILLYNVPGRTGCNLAPATVVKLSQVDAFFGVKEASGNLDQVSEIARSVREGFLIYSGDDSLTLPMLAVGARGVVSVASHIVGSEMKEMIEKYFCGDVVAARQIHLRLFPIFKGLFTTTSPIPLKWALNRLGFSVGAVRPPLYELSGPECMVVEDALRLVGKL
ncbi:MAG: 4-hydroxy-tetrahydrodipicolinate synthase [Firmicutes bacterium]|nr:4-hydroxy-tetrahydrodipicolinate synthase [Bacillota bacterium]